MPTMPTATDMKLAWLAGLFDGEGTATIFKPKGGWHKPIVSLGLTDYWLIQELKQQFGGTLRQHTPRPNHKPFWQWIVVCGTALDFLNQIRPYLRLKAPQADLVFRLGELIRPRGSGPIPPDNLAEREHLTDSIRELNRRGTS